MLKQNKFKPFDDYRCIFVHIPKTAGIAIEKSIFNTSDEVGHGRITKYRQIFPRRQFKNYFKFAIVRNPWDRLYSAYHFLKQGGRNAEDKKWAQIHLMPYHDFNDFVTRGLKQSRDILKYWHFIPQYHFICRPIFHIIDVDFVGFYENITEDYEYIQQKIFGYSKTELPRENITKIKPSKNYKQDYTDAAREMVARIYKKDIAILGYNFDNSSLPSQLAKRIQS